MCACVYACACTCACVRLQTPDAPTNIPSTGIWAHSTHTPGKDTIDSDIVKINSHMNCYDMFITNE